MPADIVGTTIFSLASGTFSLHRGPIFTDLLLVDEINRTPPRTQAALLEAMEERQVTIDGTSHPLSGFFTVFATQNPIEFEGTYPLPEAQLDRFLMKIRIGTPPPTRRPRSSSTIRRASMRESSTGWACGCSRPPGSPARAARSPRCASSRRCSATLLRLCGAPATGPR